MSPRPDCHPLGVVGAAVRALHQCPIRVTLAWICVTKSSVSTNSTMCESMSHHSAATDVQPSDVWPEMTRQLLSIGPGKRSVVG